MYLDSGRKHDLLQLDAQLKDPSYMVRRGAWKAKQRILKQSRDKKFAELRERLMKATRANDEWEAWKITNQIKEHLGEERIEWWSTKSERV